MIPLQCLGIRRSSLDNYHRRRSQRKSCTQQIVGRLHNPPYQCEPSCWQMQSDGEDNRSLAETRPPDFRSLFVWNPSRHKSLQSIPCAFERWSILQHQFSCHTALEKVLLHQGKPSTHRQLRNHLDNSVFGAIYEFSIWGYNSLRVSTLLSVMKIKINGVITFRPARSKVGKHITLYDSPDTPCAITKKASNCGLVLGGNKEVRK